MNPSKIKPVFSGLGEDINSKKIKKVLNGKIVFEMMDTMGIPPSVSLLALEKHNMAFDVVAFIKAAKDSNNFTKEKIITILTVECSVDLEIEQKIKIIADAVYK